MTREKYYEITLHLNNIHDLFTAPAVDPFSEKASFVSGIEYIESELKPNSWRSEARTRTTIFLPLASFFGQGQLYGEKEVNELLLLHSTVKDSAALRRALYEYRFMNRTRDGSRYWLIGSEVYEEEERKTP